MDKKIIPLVAITGQVLYPNNIVNFTVARSESVDALAQIINEENLVFVSTQTLPEMKETTEHNIFHIGVVGTVDRLLDLPDNKVKVVVKGLHRAKVVSFVQEEPFFRVEYEELEDIPNPFIKAEDMKPIALFAKVSFENYLTHANLATVHAKDLQHILSTSDISDIAYRIMAVLNTAVINKQKFLEQRCPTMRLKDCIKLLGDALEKLLVEKEIAHGVKKSVDKNQRDFLLREHMKVIKDQLGEKDNPNEEAENYRLQIEELNAPTATKEKLNKDVVKLTRLSSSSQEAAVVREYLDLILDLPWGEKSEEIHDIKNAEAVLEEEHYALKKVKERIIEFLAVRQKANNLDAPILCLVGPPGVGKTSIAKSVAKALGREYVRMSLGGVHDEAEIRGHRKTYLASMPGRIIAALRTIKKDNPLILLDEIDKMGKGVKGDPASALLEVLDHEQNTTFRDNYVEIPYDISDVLFICTANSLDEIPIALRDRLDILHLSSYTWAEKKEIALKYLIPKQIKKHSLQDDDFLIEENVIEDIINFYTKEAGVRQLERSIETICRKSVKKFLAEEETAILVTKDNLSNFLGNKKHRVRLINCTPEVGTVKGLAWTSVGGNTLSIEVNKAHGKGKLKLTGNIGKVMSESATAAFSYIRSECENLGIDKHFYKNVDMHIHIPEGATPKDGPSAGITMATAMVSVLSGKAVLNDVAMTGEVTIRGKVLPIGGVKEKVLAAKAAGIKKVLLPKDNEGELNEIEGYVKEDLDFVLVQNMSEVLEHALVQESVL